MCIRDSLTILEHLERRNRADLVLGGDGGVFVNVELRDAELAVLLGSDLIEDRREGAARAAPCLLYTSRCV